MNSRGWPRPVPGRFPAIDSAAFRAHFRHVTTPVEVWCYGKAVGIYIPLIPVAPGTGSRPVALEAGRWTGQRAPKRGTAAYRRLKPYLDALDEAEGNERALLKAAHDYKKPEDT